MASEAGSVQGWAAGFWAALAVAGSVDENADASSLLAWELAWEAWRLAEC